MSAIIGFAGKLGSGKDTTAERLIEFFLAPGTRVERGWFARKLKVSATACWGEQFDVSMWEEWKNDPNVKVMIVREDPTVVVGDADGMKVKADILAEETAREFLQYYGTEAHRIPFGDDFWVEQAFRAIPDCDVLVFTDVRFDNEAEELRRRGGKIVKVVGNAEDTGEHNSEAGISPHLVDYEVRNHVRGDDFYNLDRELELLGRKLFLPAYLTV